MLLENGHMDRDTWLARRVALQDRLWAVLGRPCRKVAPRGETRDRFAWDGVTVEQVVYEAEADGSVPALLYLPAHVPPPHPALVIAMGHGESKSTPGPLYAGPLYARLGIACLCADPIGEDERHIHGGQGTRAHDAAEVSVRSRAAGRSVLGKMVWDLSIGLSYLQTRGDIDPARLGCAGVSLGGTVTGYLLALDERLVVAIPAGWFFRPADREVGKPCSRVPAEAFMGFMTNGELLGLAAPHCALLVANGDADTIIDPLGFGAVRALGETMAEASGIYRLLGAAGRIGMYLVPGGGHRHYYLTKKALSWAVHYLCPGQESQVDLVRTPEVRFGDWADAHGVPLEPLYDTEAHFRGLWAADLGVQPLPVDRRLCLREDERGSPKYTLEGWIEAIERDAPTA
jgi:dienelactone hydrolase